MPTWKLVVRRALLLLLSVLRLQWLGTLEAHTHNLREAHVVSGGQKLGPLCLALYYMNLQG